MVSPVSVSSFHFPVCACARIAGWTSAGIPGGGGREFLLQKQEMLHALEARLWQSIVGCNSNGWSEKVSQENMKNE